MLSLWGNAVAALHCTCTQTFREYFPVGCKKLEFAETATDEENDCKSDAYIFVICGAASFSLTYIYVNRGQRVLISVDVKLLT